MTIALDVVIASPTDSVDMKSGLDTMQGVSDATRKIGETVLSGQLKQRLHPTDSVRTTLKGTFKGSYGHNFSFDIMDPDCKQQLRRLGKQTFVELLRYFMNEAMYEDGGDLSEKAQDKLDKMGRLAPDLIQEIRSSCMHNIHEVPKKFGYSVAVRHRVNRAKHHVISQFSQKTEQSMHAEVDLVTTELFAGITRFNINTGNGRLLIQGERETSAFGFAGAYSEVKYEAKKVFSSNLDHNNGVAEEKWKYIRLIVSPVRLKDDRVIKYIVKQYYEN